MAKKKVKKSETLHACVCVCECSKYARKADVHCGMCIVEVMYRGNNL